MHYLDALEAVMDALEDDPEWRVSISSASPRGLTHTGLPRGITCGGSATSSSLTRQRGPGDRERARQAYVSPLSHAADDR